MLYFRTVYLHTVIVSTLNGLYAVLVAALCISHDLSTTLQIQWGNHQKYQSSLALYLTFIVLKSPLRSLLLSVWTTL